MIGSFGIGKYTVEADLYRRRYTIRRGDKVLLHRIKGWADKVENLAKKFAEYDDNFIDKLCDGIYNLNYFGLTRFQQRLFDTELTVLYKSIQQVLPTVFMYRSLGLRSVIEVQIYRSLSKSPIECYSVGDIFISRTSCDVKAYTNDNMAYVRLEIEDFRPRVEYWRYNGHGFYHSSWQYVKNQELHVQRLHFQSLAKALLSLSDNPLLGCWHHLVKSSAKVHLPTSLSQILPAS